MLGGIVAGGRIKGVGPRGLTGGLAGGWSPSDLGSSLLGWWDAERSDTITLSGSAVTSWTDLVGGYVATQAISASKPIYSATSFNNRPGLTFDGLDDELTLASVPFPTGSSACEIWAPIDQTAPVAVTGSKTIISYGDTSTARRIVLRTLNGGISRARTNVGTGAGSQDVYNTSVVFEGRHLVRAIISPTATQIDVDDVAGTPVAAVPATASNRTRLGAASDAAPTAFWQGVISAILVTAPLTAPEAASLYAYLNARRA